MDLLWETPAVMARFENTGILSRELANELGLVGPALRACGGNRTRAARELGMDRTTLWRKLQKYIQK